MKKLLKVGIPALIILLAGAVFVFAGSPGEQQSSEDATQTKSAVFREGGSCAIKDGAY